METNKAIKFLVIQQKMIGDVLTSTILFEALRQKHPQAELHYLINSHTYPVVQHHPLIDKFIFFTPEIETKKAKLLGLIKDIRSAKYDFVIDVYSKLSSNILSFFSGAPKRISYYKSYTHFLYTDTVKRGLTASTAAGLAIENRLQLLEPLGFVINTEYKPKIYLTAEERLNAGDVLNVNGINLNNPIIMVSVLGSGASKTYPSDYIAQTIDIICENLPDAQLLFNYIPSQAEDARAIYDQCLKNSQDQIYFNVFGKSLREFLALTSHCTAVIGNEGGAINMAKALDVRTFAIFAPWISKETWQIFDDDRDRISVHLLDYDPEQYNNINQLKKLKPKAKELYRLFSPNLFEDKLISFLKRLS